MGGIVSSGDRGCARVAVAFEHDAVVDFTVRSRPRSSSSLSKSCESSGGGVCVVDERFDVRARLVREAGPEGWHCG